MIEKFTSRALRIAAFLPLFGFSSFIQAMSPFELTTARITESTQQAHNIERWQEKALVRANVAIQFGGQSIVDGVFTFEAHGPRARYDRADGTQIIFDGKTAWVSPGDAKAPKGRFHVLTWPWFIMAPFKMQGDGIELSEASLRPLRGEKHKSVFQTFGSDMGDTPDDWYRFFINRETDLVDGMSYIVTYGKDMETANASPSIILYSNYTEGAEPRIAQNYEFWFWNPETGETVGDTPKGVGQVSDIQYLPAKAVDFSIPEGASELKMPLAAIDYTSYAALLEKYVTPSGVRYEAWYQSKEDRDSLEAFLQYAATLDIEVYPPEDQKAFFINLYNAGMLQAVFDNYPLKSVRNIGLIPFSIFKKDFVEVKGGKVSLDVIQKEILFKDFFDPRIHFAINCASESCPPLLDEPYTGKQLEQQLDAQTRAFAQSARAARVMKGKGRIAYSELFKWYADDFDVDTPAAYLNRFRTAPLPLDLKTDWIDYDWALNRAQ